MGTDQDQRYDHNNGKADDHIRNVDRSMVTDVIQEVTVKEYISSGKSDNSRKDPESVKIYVVNIRLIPRNVGNEKATGLRNFFFKIEALTGFW